MKQNRKLYKYMKQKLLLFLAILSVIAPSCRDDDEAPRSTIDKEFQPYFDAFVEEMNARAPDTSIDFSQFIVRFANPGELDTGIYGNCSKLGGYEIKVSRPIWDGPDSIYREVLIFHELGHCALRRGHDEQMLRFYNCKSLMTAIVGGSQCGTDVSSPMWREYYLQELFGPAVEPDWINMDTAYFLQTPLVDFFESEGQSASIDSIGNEDFQVELFFDSLANISFQLGDYNMDFKYIGWLQPNGERIYITRAGALSIIPS
ncbi:MAG: hypothetical protein GC192_17620 [Bacteroidetes bacterium]|nr:hypothetical protein [Bacteroidota bacterium]